MLNPSASAGSARIAAASSCSCQSIGRAIESTTPLPISTLRTWPPRPSEARTHASTWYMFSEQSRMPCTSTTGSGREARRAATAPPPSPSAASSPPATAIRPPRPEVAPLRLRAAPRNAPPRPRRPPRGAEEMLPLSAAAGAAQRRCETTAVRVGSGGTQEESAVERLIASRSCEIGSRELSSMARGDGR